MYPLASHVVIKEKEVKLPYYSLGADDKDYCQRQSIEEKSINVAATVSPARTAGSPFAFVLIFVLKFGKIS